MAPSRGSGSRPAASTVPSQNRSSANSRGSDTLPSGVRIAIGRNRSAALPKVHSTKLSRSAEPGLIPWTSTRMADVAATSGMASSAMSGAGSTALCPTMVTVVSSPARATAARRQARIWSRSIPPAQPPRAPSADVARSAATRPILRTGPGSPPARAGASAYESPSCRATGNGMTIRKRRRRPANRAASLHLVDCRFEHQRFTSPSTM